MPKLKGRFPSYRRHRPSGRAVVTINGQDKYLGPHGSKTSIVEYDRLIAEWLAGGRQPAYQNPPPAEQLSVNALILAYVTYAGDYYRHPDGRPTTEVDNIRQALRPVRQLYGRTAATAFGPKSLAAVREHMIQLGWCRRNINKQIHRIGAMFRWASSQEMLPEAIYRQLKTLAPLKRGRTTAREMPRVRPAAQAMIDAVLGRVSRQVGAIIRLELLTGARSGEIVPLRPMDLQHTAEEIWTVEPEQHKTAYRDLAKTIYFGPQAQAILKEFLAGRPMDACLFSPAEAEEERRQQQHKVRKTSPDLGNRPGTHRVPQPRRTAGDHYTVDSLRRAIQRACEDAYPPPEHLAKAKRQAKNRPKTRCWETDAEWRERLGPDQWNE